MIECDKYRNYYYRKKSIERKTDKIEDVLFDKKKKNHFNIVVIFCRDKSEKLSV